MLNLCAGCLSGGHLAGSYELERVQLHDGGGGGSEVEVPWHWILGSGFDCGELRLAYRRRPTDQPEESEEVHEDEEEEWERPQGQITFHPPPSRFRPQQIRTSAASAIPREYLFISEKIAQEKAWN